MLSMDKGLKKKALQYKLGSQGHLALVAAHCIEGLRRCLCNKIWGETDEARRYFKLSTLISTWSHVSGIGYRKPTKNGITEEALK